MKDDKDFEDEHSTADDGDERENTTEPAEDSSKGAISADLIRGHINTIILRTLDERDKYGYEIINEIEDKSHGQYTLKQPTLYSALKRLETQGYIKAYWKTDEVSSGGRRKYFTLTELGREYSEKNQAEWEYSRTVIDSLISDRSFDFSQPAPTPVDFNILKKSVSRVYTGGKSEESESVVPDEKRASPDVQSEYAKKYDQIENSPVRNEYNSQTVRDVYVGKEPEQQPSEQSGKTAEEENQPARAQEQTTTQPMRNEETVQAQPAPESAAAQDTQPAQQQDMPFPQQPQGIPYNAQQPMYDGGQYSQTVNNVYGQPQGAYGPVYTDRQVNYYGDYSQPYPPYGASYPQQGYVPDPYNRTAYPYPQPPAQPYPQQENGAGTQIPEQPIKRDLFATQTTPEQPRDTRTEEEKRATHENFIKLISEQNDKERGIVPNSEDIDTEKLIYTNRPETERDYKKLVSNIFNRAIKQSEPPKNQPAPQEDEVQPEQPQQTQTSHDQIENVQNVHYSYPADPAVEKARADGLKINTSSPTAARARGSRGTTFNRGAALFASSVIVAVILLIEFAVCMALMQPLGIGIMYPITLLIIAVVQLGVFGTMYACGFGRGSIRPASHGYISLCIVLTIISVLVICLVSFLLDINLQSATDIAIKIIIPSITALNITIFGVSYYFISK